ncbi:MAG TPA: hypothetical protein PLZ36_17395, partial [Armatimonadota bacterium]|nr:hypothetical protein [Armatimonadota bacterium]
NAGLETIPAAGRQALVLDRYAAGLSLAESFYAALPSLGGQNLIIGDPLCAPYAKKPVVTIESGEAPLSGTAALKITGTAIEPGQTIQRMDLYLDDRFYATLYEPQGAAIHLRIGDHALEYPVPPGAEMRELLAGLAAQVNGHPVLSRPDGVRALPSPATASLQLVARAPGAEGNDLPVAVAVESAERPAVELSARLSGDRLTGGGQKPSPARGALSFLGRRMKPGDAVAVKIGPERVTYTIPTEQATLPALLAALAGRINAAPALAGADGVRAFPDPDGMPVLLLEARTPGEGGNRISFAVAVTPVEGSQLRAYPDTPSRLLGGHDGSSASVQVAFVLGEPAVRRTVLLDTSRLSDGAHRLRAVACDGSPAQAQGFAEIALLVRNHPTGPTVSLPDQLGPALGAVTVPVTAGEGIAKVEVFVDGQLLGAAEAAPFAVRVPLASLGRGAHDLWAEGITADGRRYRTAPSTLHVVVPPEVLGVTPDHAQPRGGATHRVIGTGFQPDCTVRLAGVPAKTVIYRSPNILEVVSEAGEAARGPVDVMNPDGTTGSLPHAFEYYLPRVASAKLTPARDVVRVNGTARFAATCFDQFGYPIAAAVTWPSVMIRHRGEV